MESVLNKNSELYELIEKKQFKGTAGDALAEFAGRVCYASEARFGDAPGFVSDRMAEGHADVVEHGWLSALLPYVPKFKPNRYLTMHFKNDWCRVSGNLRAWYDSNAVNTDHGGILHDLLRRASPSVFGSYGQIASPEYGSVNSTEHVQALGWCYAAPGLDEHNHATVLLDGVSRSLTHQLVRHRLGSFCLSGDTVVPCFRTKRSSGKKKWTMKQLWDWQNDPKRKGRLKLIRLRGVNDRRELIPVKIGRVISSGKQQLYKVTTGSGRVIRSTLKHRYLSPTLGWCHLDELSVGDEILANGIPAYKNPEYLRQRYLVENVERKVLAKQLGVSDACLGQWIRKFGLQKPKSQYPGRKPGYGRKGALTEIGRERLRNKRGAANCRWKGDAVGNTGGRIRANKMYEAKECTRCGSTLRVQRHHIDRNPVNNDVENIAILCELCHKAEHFGQVVMTVFRDKIVSIEKDSVEDTYDLEIDDPCHCFVANGFVVHNSQRSQRYVDQNKAGWQYVTPPGIASNQEANEVYDACMVTISWTYRKLRDMGVRKEDARFVLPNADATKLVVSMTFEGWRHFIWLRALDVAAQWEIRAVAQEILAILNEIAPSEWEREISKLETDKRLKEGF